MPATHRRYVVVLAVLAAVTLVPIAGLNLQLLRQSLGLNELTLAASRWQQDTHGVVNVSGGLDGHRLFKTLRLNDRLATTDTLVLGSSTVMGLTADALGSPRAFNFATSSNALNIVISEAEYLQAHHPGIRRLVIPIDWALGFAFWDYPPPLLDVTVEAARREAGSEATLTASQRWREALSYPRIVQLFDVLRTASTASDRRRAFADAFLSRVGPAYRCGDGTPARDFDVVNRGVCHGFRFDGSATFNGFARVAGSDEAIHGAASPDGAFVKNLRLTGGEPNAQLLWRLAAIADRARESGGALLVLRPALLPGLEAAVRQLPMAGAALQRTDAVLNAWAREHRVAMIDAGRSEEVGCVAAEFIDTHHAVESCYRKVFAAGWPRTR